MSKTDTPSSNNSRASSETSETQSVEENISVSGNESKVPPSINTSIDSPRKSKRMKDANNDKETEKRPPWRAVSLSTLPKPDKNALLKAKLLDASRRLRAGKSSVAVQTDIVPTKLMKEVNLGAQVDLILHREVSIMTDGSYMKKKQGNDEFILTYAVSTFTDDIQFTENSTQTLLPKLPEQDFMKAYLECDLSAANSQQFTETQRNLIRQICKLRETTKLNDVAAQQRDTQSASALGNYKRSSLLNGGTLKSWHFELDEDGDCAPNFAPYTITANRPWDSFAPLALEGLYSQSMGNHQSDWNILFLAIDELIRESNCLVDIIEDLARGRQIETNEIPSFEHQTQKLPSEYWLPIIEEQEKTLETMIKDMKSGSGE